MTSKWLPRWPVFSGLVAALGSVRSLRREGGGGELDIAAHLSGEALQRGESIAVNGACLTVTAQDAAGFRAQLSPETLHRSTLGALRPGEEVNLERALRVGDRLGGHLVLGHVDATTRLASVARTGNAFTLRFGLSSALAPEVAEKGSIAVDGISLTVARVGPGWFEVVIIPATWDSTVLRRRRVGDSVNLETDVLAKYVRRSLAGARPALADLLNLDGYEAD